MSLFWLSWSISSTINEQGGKQITATLTTFGQSILALDKKSCTWLWSDKKPQSYDLVKTEVSLSLEYQRFKSEKRTTRFIIVGFC